MMSASDPQRGFRRRIALQAGAAWALALLAAAWAWRVPVPAVAVPAMPAARVAAAVAAPPDPVAWNVDLWRPFPGEAPAAAPTTLRLYSILQRGDRLIAAIAAADAPDLAYVSDGDACHGYTVVRVEPGRVLLRGAAGELQLELGP